LGGEVVRGEVIMESLLQKRFKFGRTPSLFQMVIKTNEATPTIPGRLLAGK